MNAIKSVTKLQWAFSAIVALVVAVLFANGMYAEGIMLANAPLAVDLESLAKEFKTKTSEFSTVSSDLKEMQKELSAKYSNQEKISTELKESIDKALTNFNGLKGVVEGLEQKLAAEVENEQKTAKSWGEQFVASDSFKSVGEGKSSRRGTISHEVKQVTSAAAGGLIRSQREAEVTNLMRERRVVRDLLRTVPIQTSSVDYAVQLTRTNAAAPVAESASKPYSDFTWGSATANVRTLAHLAKITRQAMDDAPRLIGEIDSEMRYGLGYVEERQFLYGSGVGQNLHGIVPQASAFVRPAGFGQMANASRIDVLRVAILQNSLSLLPADGIVINELDWALIELTKTTEGAYLFANPQGSVEARMWALPVVATPAMVAGDFLVGSFRMGATVYDRMGVEVLISTENDIDFEQNLATMRAEERVAIAVKRPQAFTKGTFSTAIAALGAV